MSIRGENEHKSCESKDLEGEKFQLVHLSRTKIYAFQIWNILKSVNCHI
jgi:hypothetical protein